MAKLKPRSDAFFLGMKGSIQAFYDDLQRQGKPRIDLEFGAHLVDICERTAAAFKPLPAPASATCAQSRDPQGPLVAVLGGTGFIGSYTVAALLEQGYRVRVMARGVRNLQAVFHRPGVELVPGDVKREADIERSWSGCSLCHQPGSWRRRCRFRRHPRRHGGLRAGCGSDLARGWCRASCACGLDRRALRG